MAIFNRMGGGGISGSIARAAKQASMERQMGKAPGKGQSKTMRLNPATGQYTVESKTGYNKPKAKKTTFRLNPKTGQYKGMAAARPQPTNFMTARMGGGSLGSGMGSMAAFGGAVKPANREMNMDSRFGTIASRMRRA
jgi:hypothetical protein